MTATQEIVRRVDALGTDRVFSIADLGLPAEWWENIRVKLGRMVKTGKLVKITKGKYYKPRVSILGPVPPSPKELVKDLLYNNGELEGYLTGYSIWDSMGLTSQFSSILVIGLNRRKGPINRGGRNIRFVIQPNLITADNIKFLQFLDTLKYIKDIPDTTIDSSINRLQEIIAAFDKDGISTMIDLSMKYPPRVRALLGALVENRGLVDITGSLKQSINPLTTFRIGISPETLPTAQHWSIV